ncbi:DNA polymerase-4 [Sphingobium wenxiniae]|uniref:DNA polymerase-4 n=2 Tax=Sphingobium wenxiniae (strain DSM 21828 / CGMCC 1.7748 / JZ-1) TaxID=595605 RepID=A0A562K8A1_SPHWJ|nr:DNA polymerase-4 [Sphingobium wenxiniae]
MGIRNLSARRMTVNQTCLSLALGSLANGHKLGGERVGIPGVGTNMAKRLIRSRIVTVSDLYDTEPKQMRKIWRSVTGERLWYALHGYDVQAPESRRGMFGHGRVLPPECRAPEGARAICRVLLTKAARRLRREGFYCSGVWLWLDHGGGHWSGKRVLPTVHDDQALLSEFEILWREAVSHLPPRTLIYRLGVTLFDLSPSDCRQLDFLLADDSERQRWEAINTAIDLLNYKWGKTVASIGFWPHRHVENIGGKISYTRIPSAEDFW